MEKDFYFLVSTQFLPNKIMLKSKQDTKQDIYNKHNNFVLILSKFNSCYAAVSTSFNINFKCTFLDKKNEFFYMKC